MQTAAVRTSRADQLQGSQSRGSGRVPGWPAIATDILAVVQVQAPSSKAQLLFAQVGHMPPTLALIFRGYLS